LDDDPDFQVNAYFKRCWVRSDLAAQWLDAHGIPMPDYLSPEPDRPTTLVEGVKPTAGATEGAEAAVPAHEAARMPFNRIRAKALLIAEKKGGIFKDRIPPEKETRLFLLRTFSGVPNDPHRAIRREVWPRIRRGRPTASK